MTFTAFSHWLGEQDCVLKARLRPLKLVPAATFLDVATARTGEHFNFWVMSPLEKTTLKQASTCKRKQLKRNSRQRESTPNQARQQPAAAASWQSAGATRSTATAKDVVPCPGCASCKTVHPPWLLGIPPRTSRPPERASAKPLI